MNRNYLIGFAASAAVLALLALVFSMVFEIYPEIKNLSPSREADVNNYLALDRWLGGMGIPARIKNSGDLSVISGADERRVYLQSSLFRWTDEAAEYLARWVEEGGTLFLALDEDLYVNSFPTDKKDSYGAWLLLEKFGIKAETDSSQYRYDSNFPNYDRRLSLDTDHEENTLFLKDRSGSARLAQVKRGKGTLIVTGRTAFLHSWNINREPNARLAWAFFAADPKKESWLFIRGQTQTTGIMGTLFSQGNLIVLLVSGLVLLVIGFWSAIPMFGLVRGGEEKPGKPLRERFLAEGRFLKRYGALEIYSRVYLNEIKRRLARRALSAGPETQRITEIWGKPDELLAKILGGETIRFRDFPKAIIILKTILERL